MGIVSDNRFRGNFCGNVSENLKHLVGLSVYAERLDFY